MALSYTSVRVDASGSDSGSTSVTVPSGCTCVAALWGANSDTGHITSLTLNSVSLTLEVDVDGAGNQTYGVGYLDDPDTGSQTFAWNWGSRGGWCDDGQIYLIFAESSTGLARFLSADGDSLDGLGTPGPLSLTSTADSLCVALGTYASGSPDLSASGAQTVTTNNETANGFGHDIAYRNTPGDPSTSMTMASAFYPTFTAVSFEEVTGGGGTTITASGISSAESVGNPVITTGAVTVLPSGVATAELFGSPLISPTYQISPSGISSAESVGNPTVDPGSVGISPASIGSSEAFGSATVSQGGVFVLPSAISSVEAFGNSAISPGGVFVLPAGISSAEAFGLAVVTSGAIIAPASIATLEAFGLVGVSPGVVVILPTGIQSGEAFGAAQIGDVVVAGNFGIVSGIVSGIIRELVK